MRIAVSGITAVLNLQTIQEMGERGYSWSNMTQIYSSRGIKKSINFPIDDRVENDYAEQVFTAAQYLNNLIAEKRHSVFIHCTSGLSRAPTVVLTYLCLFKRVKCWMDLRESLKFLRVFFP
jgi:protein-tyrosine phosphatase